MIEFLLDSIDVALEFVVVGCLMLAACVIGGGILTILHMIFG